MALIVFFCIFFNRIYSIATDYTSLFSFLVVKKVLMAYIIKKDKFIYLTHIVDM